jgi:Fungal chitosanase of glycosyl hydrolase group 75
LHIKKSTKIVAVSVVYFLNIFGGRIMDLLFPAKGAHLPISHPVVFSGTAGPNTVRVKMKADRRFMVGENAIVEGKWTVARTFSATGEREIEVVGLDATGNEVESLTFSLFLVEAHTIGYTPPAGMAAHLGDIAFQLEIAERRQPDIAGLEAMFILPDGALYFESDLDLDTDGEKDPNIKYERTHQNRTTLRKADGKPLNANTIPFFVLPGLHFDGHAVTIEDIKINLGDIAAVLYKNTIEFAVFADTGPAKPKNPVTKIGEGSIALHRSLGFERVKNGRIRDVGIDKDVVTIVFPGSGDGTVQTPEAIREKGKQLFKALGGKL